MSVGSKAVSKRSARPYVEDGMEKETHDQREKWMAKHEDTESDRQERRSSTLTATTFSSQSSVDSFPLDYAAEREHDVDPWVPGTNPGARDAFHPRSSNQHVAYSIDELEEGLPSGSRPANFGIVVPGVYRSSFPQSQDYAFVAGLKLKTIVTLVQKDFPEGYDEFLRKNGIRHYVFDMKGTKKEAIPIKTMKSILRLVLDRRNHPLLIHCNHGKHRTGCVVAVVRKLSGWDLGNIISEYKSYADPKARQCDINYITGFELGDLSSLFRDGNWPFRPGSFLRATLFTIMMVIVWLLSATKIVPAPKRKLMSDEPKTGQ